MASNGGHGSAASKAKSSADDATDKAQSAAASAENHPAADWVTAAGQIANGLVHFIIGAIALGIAFGDGGSADQQGAMRAIEQTPLGGVAIWAVAIAMLALALHAFVSAVADSRRDRTDALKSAGRGIAYAAVGVTALTAALGSSGSGDSDAKSLSAALMEQPFGLFLVGAVGVATAAVGVYFVIKGVQKKFLEDVAPPARFRHAVELLGMVGYPAKGVAIFIVGALFVIAAFTHDADQAAGLDGALQSLTTVPGGVFALIAVALGLMIYGVYCLARGLWNR
ncbi:DUF1206 domain-containing protein [Agrococcus sp. ProA11]|uniref:DUF1206 domain-containing protein n=1 Tax=Agrococcus chionoecetis TaxID=3153752 RepID=UPI0032617D6B